MKKNGFTLIELSIVLVIIGLIIGGVLVGQNLISAAGIRAQISQIEKYQTAVNTFKGKYGYLPGDIPEPTATQVGLTPRGTCPGMGDGNGLLEGVDGAGCGANSGLFQTAGESPEFWSDLSYANGMNIGLIDGSFSAVVPFIADPPSSAQMITGTLVDTWFPKAKIGHGNYIYVWSGGYGNGLGTADHYNYFGLSQCTGIWTPVGGSNMTSAPGLTVSEAYNIDVKMDDGLPQSGRVMAFYDGDWVATWAAGGGASGAAGGGNVPTTNATAASATTCYDNNGTAGIQKYSMGQNNGSGMNCALSFRFQ